MKVVIGEPRGGLGDALLYSTLPELFAYDGHEVWVNAHPRNQEVARLLYSDNPYITGMTAEAPTAGCVHDREFFPKARLHRSPIGFIEALHGFDESSERPKIYYTPKERPDVADLVFADPRSISQQFPAEVFHAFSDRLFEREEITVLESRNSGVNGAEALARSRRYIVKDIYEYIDIIASCRAFLSTESGGHSLAASVRYDGIYALCTTAHMNSRFFVYPGVNYTVVDGLSPTYLAVDP